MKTWVMPKMDLTGSDKQVIWATDIIADIYSTVNANNKLACEKQWPHADKWEEAFGLIIRQIEDFLSKNEQAGVIISCRERFRSDRILYLANKYVNLSKF